MVVQGALADPRLGGDGVHPDGAYALRIEQLVGRGEDALGRGWGRGSVYFQLDSTIGAIRSYVHRSVYPR
jgi:hypothetical protein